MDTEISAEAINFIICSLFKCDIDDDDIGSITMKHNYWRTESYDLGRKGRDYDDYAAHLRGIFDRCLYSQVVSAISQSDLPIHERVSIMQFLNTNVMTQTMVDLCANVQKLLDKDARSADSDSNDGSDEKKDIPTLISGLEEKVDKIKSNVRKLKYEIRSISRETADISRETSNISRETADIKSKCESTDTAVGIIDDKFNLLSSFIDLAANK